MDNDYNVTLAFTNVSLLNSNWSIHGLNVAMIKANLSQAWLWIHRIRKQANKGFVHITNSTFGYLNVSRQFDISMLNCYIDGTTRLQSTLIHTDGSNVTIKGSIIHKNKIEGFEPLIQATNSEVYLNEVNFTTNSGSYLLQVSNRSTSHMKQLLLSCNRRY